MRGACDHDKGLIPMLDHIKTTLAQVFPDQEIVLVQDVYTGYRRRPGEYILLVEVNGTQNAGELRPRVMVVKLNQNASALKEEHDGWHHAGLMDLMLTSYCQRFG